MWAHISRPTKFCLCVDDFGIKYVSKKDADYLLTALRSVYDITVDLKGDLFCGLTLEWNYKHGYVDISMPFYVQKTLTKLNHIPSSTPQHAPHRWVPITYGKKIQNTQVEDISPSLHSSEI